MWYITTPWAVGRKKAYVKRLLAVPPKQAMWKGQSTAKSMERGLLWGRTDDVICAKADTFGGFGVGHERCLELLDVGRECVRDGVVFNLFERTMAGLCL